MEYNLGLNKGDRKARFHCIQKDIDLTLEEMHDHVSGNGKVEETDETNNKMMIPVTVICPKGKHLSFCRPTSPTSCR